MTSLDLERNPFKVFTPEDMEASDVHDLFVDPFTDFNKMCDPGHTMLSGPRGCGKSMIFRYLLPDCQSLSLSKGFSELPFLAFLVSIKNTGPNITEFGRMRDRHADLVLNEHLLTVFVATKIFASLSRSSVSANTDQLAELNGFLKSFNRRAVSGGGTTTEVPDSNSSPQEVFRSISDACDKFYCDMLQYARRLIYSGDEPARYDGPLFGYVDFLLPLLHELKALSIFPRSPIYLLFDDADYLSTTQTIVLNSWISTRTQADVSIKVSSQLRYKTFATVSGLPIQSPHDFQHINVSDVYTTRHGRYLSRVEEIVAKRLMKAGIDVSPREFFAIDKTQEEAIAQIATRLKGEWKEDGRGFRPSDDVTRYARPEYFRTLGGASKSTSTYSYSGFEQLVHISSGLVRYFLEPAAIMFDEQKSRNSSEHVKVIENRIQDQVIRDAADNLMFSEFDIIRNEEAEKHTDSEMHEQHLDDLHNQMDKLRNLISALGGTFRLKLVSDDSERRVFSVAISGEPDWEVINILELGVRYGYFHRSSIGNKDGTGRTRLYVLTRRLAPYFKLDPSSFAGYLWVTSAILREAMTKPDTLLRKIKKDGVSKSLETSQLTLFE